MIAILNYGLGNIKAFGSVYDRLNIKYQYASTKSDLINCTKVILPGVGSFDQAITKLNSSGMRDFLDHLVINKALPVLGVCVGMQLMAENSDEGNMKGLGWISGQVKRFDYVETKAPIPHMGWNNVEPVGVSPLTVGLGNFPRF